MTDIFSKYSTSNFIFQFIILLITVSGETNNANYFWDKSLPLNIFGYQFNEIIQEVIPEFNRITKELNISSQCEQRLRELIVGEEYGEWKTKSTIIILIIIVV